MSTPTMMPTIPLAVATPPRIRAQHDALADFFGAPPMCTQSQASLIPNPMGMFLPPPPYESRERLPRYTDEEDEPVTVAKYMFRYGFLFPPFWILGIIILFSPLKATDDWETDKTEEERTMLLERMREAEVKWARRCLLAVLGLGLIVVLAVLIVLAITRRR